MENSRNSLRHTVDSQIEYLWGEIRKGTKEAKKSILVERRSTAYHEYKVMSFILTGALALTHSRVSFSHFNVPLLYI